MKHPIAIFLVWVGLLLLVSPLLADTCPASVPAGVTSCFYAANSGSDTTGDGSKANPWAHIRTMQTCTGNCAAHTPVAGEGFIFKGGDTWDYTNFGMAWNYSGTASATPGVSTAPIYIGVDKSWYTGGSWTRPTWTCGGAAATSCANNSMGNLMIQVYAHDVIIDNINFTGLYIKVTDSGYQYILFVFGNDVVENSYFHGWALQTLVTGSVTAVGSGTGVYTVTLAGGGSNGLATANVNCSGFSSSANNGSFSITSSTSTTITTNNGSSTSAGTYGTCTTAPRGNVVAATGYIGGGTDALIGTQIINNVCDGSDTAENDGTCFGNAWKIENNYVGYVYNGINGVADYIDGNTIEHIDFFAASGSHCNGVYHKGPIDTTALTMYAYNNVMRNSVGSGCVYFYVNGGGSGQVCPTCKMYIYDNVIYNLPNASTYISTGSDSGDQSGTFYIDNNTIEAGHLPCMGNGLNANVETVNFDNNQCITTGGSVCSVGTSGTCVDGGHNLLRTQSQAAADCTAGSNCYVASSNPAYFPPAGGNTIGVGANMSSSVPTYGSAFGYDSSYACTYNTSNHTVSCPALTANYRPASAAWDIGAYQFAQPPGSVFTLNTITTSGTAVH